MATVNLMDDEPRGGGGEPILPDGWHDVQIRSFKEGKTPTTNNPYVEYFMGNAQGTIKRSFYITPKAKWILKNFVGCCGYTGDLRNFDFKAIIGARVKVQVGLGNPNKQGKAYREVIDFAPIDGSRVVEDDEDMF